MNQHVKTTGLPSLDGLRNLLEPYLTLRAYLVPMTFANGKPLGNNGDRLMHAVFRRILTEFGIRVTEVPEEAELIIVPPNGALLEAYTFPTLLANRIKELPDVPLVLFPSSALFPTVDPGFIFEGRVAPTLWILRERYSFEHLTESWGSSLASKGVTLRLDHDVVASGHKFVKDVVGRSSSGGGAVVAAREDKEASAELLGANPRAGSAVSGHLFTRLKRLVPHGALYSLLARTSRRRRTMNASVRLVARLDERQRNALNAYGKRVVFSDLSAPQYATFNRYRRILARADLVVTDRLHVALPAAVLGKQVVLVEAGYHKLQGVYEQSLAESPNVTLLIPK